LVWILQIFNTLGSIISPYLIESEVVPAKVAYIQSNTSYSSRLDFHTLKAYFQISNWLFTQNNRLFLSTAAETFLISETSADLSNFKERYTRTNQFSPYLSSQVDFNTYQYRFMRDY